MEMGQMIIGAIVAGIDRLIRIVKKYGIWRVIEAIVILTAALYLIHNVSNIPQIVSDVFSHNKQQELVKHDAAIKTRRAIRPEIDDILHRSLSYLNADRVFIMELHNGTNSMSGLPFIYGEMTYEDAKTGISHIDEDYVSINLSRFEFPIYLKNNRMFYGTIEELSEIDEKLAMRMKSNEATYIAIISLHGVTNELGYFGLTYCNGNKPADEESIREQLTICSQKLAILLDSASVDNL